MDELTGEKSPLIQRLEALTTATEREECYKRILLGMASMTDLFMKWLSFNGLEIPQIIGPEMEKYATESDTAIGELESAPTIYKPTFH